MIASLSAVASQAATSSVPASATRFSLRHPENLIVARGLSRKASKLQTLMPSICRTRNV
jgi:hypothetical protein